MCETEKELEAEVAALTLQNQELQKKLDAELAKCPAGCADQACACPDYWDVVKMYEGANRLLREARIALEIASPSMTHTFSGHTYEHGIPVEWVDGCGKCRVMAILMPREKRVASSPNDEGCCFHHKGTKEDPVYCWCKCHPLGGLQS